MNSKSDFESQQKVGMSQGARAGGGAGAAGSSARDIGEKAKQAAGEIADTQISTQKEKASGGLGQVAQALRKSGEYLRGQQQEQIAGYIEKAANQLERISESIKSADVRELFDQVEGLARREPAMFLGGAFALGLLGARFLKSSGRHGASQSSRFRNMQGPTSSRHGNPRAIGGYGSGYGTQAGQLGTSEPSPYTNRPADWPPVTGEH